MRPGLVVTFNEAFAAFILAYERNAALQARCSAGENFDPASIIEVRFRLYQAGEALVSAASGGVARAG
jgi:hypothetical protein